MDETLVYIAPMDTGTIILGDDNSTIIIGDDKTCVIAAPPDLVVLDPTESLTPGTIILGDQFGTVVIGDDPVSITIADQHITVMGSDVAGPPGPQGPPGEGSGDAADVTYESATYSTVKSALDALLYVFPNINSFTNNVGTVELGSAVSSVTLSWSLNKAMTSLSLDHSIGSVLGLTSKSLTGLSLTSDATWTLSARDGSNTTSAQTTVTFRNRRYWGVSASEELDNTGVLGLNGSEFATSFNKAVTYDATGGRYVYYAYPATWGTPSNVTVGGLQFSDFIVSTLDLTNASGHTESYNVVRLRNFQTGSAININWA
jgi:hypothetical protein